MQAELLTCGICSLEYNETTCIPKLIPTCGHTICSTCLDNVLQQNDQPVCPLDQSVFPVIGQTSAAFTTNLMLLAILDETLKQKYEQCETHNEPLNLVCITHKSKICKLCADSDLHKKHTIIHINDLRNEAKARKKQLESGVKEFDTYQRNIEKFLKEEKDSILLNAKERFKRIKELIVSKEEEVYLEINSFFAVEGVEINDKLEKDLTLRNTMQQKISELDNHIISQQFFESLRDETLVFNIKANYDRLLQLTEENKQKFEEGLDTLETTFINLIQQLQLLIPSQQLGELIEAENNDIIDSDNYNFLRLSNLLKVDDRDGWLVISPQTDNSKGNNEFWDLAQKSSEWKSMKRISLEFMNIKVSSETLQAIYAIWKQLKSVSDLSVTFSEEICSDQDLSIFCLNSFWALPGIQTLHINLERCNITDQGFVELVCEALAKMIGIKTLNIQLGRTKISDSSLEAFSKHMLPVLTNLESLRLGIYRAQVTDVSLSKVFTGLKARAGGLRLLSLDLSETEIQQESIKILTNNLIPFFKSLETFQLLLEDTQVSDKVVRQLLIAIDTIAHHLKTFEMNLNGIDVIDKSIEVFSEQTLPNLCSLDSFSLLLAHTQITDKAIEYIANNIEASLKNVTTFVFDLRSTLITDVGVDVLASRVLPVVRPLEKLGLYLENTNITDGSIRNLFTSMGKEIEGIKTLLLSFSKTRITDDSFSVFSELTLPALKTLERFELDLGTLSYQMSQFNVCFRR